ncbi:NAD(P)-dependent alcohol dehydrogenase [Blastomonas sp.]|uniref:NAD(P)-dependent alcohol dehydrogenase n=1 Tax=Blastomonas sp. TaxID=1909299 RepID=UPI00391D34C0
MLEIQAAVARTPSGPFTIEAVQISGPRDDEVLVKIAGVGLCHTDIVFKDQFVPYPLPAVLGHEGAGVVEAIGTNVHGVAVGDRVVLGFSSCGTCPRCDEGLPSYCRTFVPLNYAGQRLDDGSTALAGGDESIASHFFGQSSFASHAIVRQRNVVKVGDTKADLALLGPLGCGFQTGAGGIMRSLACPAGSSLAVFGGGPVGLAAVMGAVIQGCSIIVLVEPVAARRDIALSLGATHVIDPSVEDVTAAIRSIIAQGIDFAFDTTGNIGVIDAAMASLGSHGAIGLVGVPKNADASIAVNIAQVMTFGHRIIGIIEGDSDPQTFIPELLQHHDEGRFPFDSLIKTFPLSQINQAIADQARGDCVKAVLIPDT